MTLIVAEDLHKAYTRGSERVEALRGVNLRVDEGDFVVLLGPSGSGKSTLLNLLGGIDRPSDGTLSVSGLRLHQLSEIELDRYRREHVGYVFQFNNLIPTLSATDNVALPLLARGSNWKNARRDARSLLQDLGLASRESHLPSQLSGGEQQRVALARAVIGKPPLILADEPTGDLDADSARVVLELMRHLNRDLGTTFVLATHDTAISELADQVVTLTDGRPEQGHKAKTR